jgi:hypothetical protein
MEEGAKKSPETVVLKSIGNKKGDKNV